MRSSQLHVSSVQVSVVLPAIEAVSHLALRLHHVLDHGQEGHLVLDALGQRQVALESAVQRLALLRALGHNHLGHLHLASAPLIAAGMHHVHRSKYKYKSNDSLSGWYLTAALSGWSPPKPQHRWIQAAGHTLSQRTPFGELYLPYALKNSLASSGVQGDRGAPSL